MRSILTGVVALLGAAGICFGRRGADLAGDEVAGRAALRRPAHDLVADVGYRQHVPGYAGGARLGRQDGDPLSRQVVDHQRGRQNLYLQAARRRDVLQRQEVHRRRRRLQLQAAEGSRNQGAVRIGALEKSRNCARPILIPSSTSSTNPTPNCCCSSPCTPTRSTIRRAWRRSARITASRESTAPGHGASRAGSRARKSC